MNCRFLRFNRAGDFLRFDNKLGKDFFLFLIDFLDVVAVLGDDFNNGRPHRSCSFGDFIFLRFLNESERFRDFLVTFIYLQ